MRSTRPDATVALERGQEQPGRHHQTRRHLLAHPADPGRQVSRDDRAPTIGQDLDLGGGAQGTGWQKAVVALANKNARILWAVMTRGIAFDPDHLNVKPMAA